MDLNDSLKVRQAEVCRRFGVEAVAIAEDSVVGVSRTLDRFAPPIHGLRHPAQGQTNGWYIWTGELLSDADFFEPVHTSHIDDVVPEVLPYLCLPPGWRFLLAPDHEDVWYDEELLNV